MKVLYIAGWGRSGTTILDNIVGSYDSAFTTGELYYLWRRGLNQGRSCGCGTKLPHCRTWCATVTCQCALVCTRSVVLPCGGTVPV
jgi:hypothetical protein